jgi:fibronectin type III domain protein
MKRLSRCGAVLVFGVALSSAAIALPAGAAPHKPTKPGAPTITSVKPGFHSATVSFSKPASNGGAPILNYRVVCTSSNGGAKGANEGPRSPIKVSGLTTGKTYTCTVSAKNKVGRGPASAPSDSFMPTKHK